MPKPESDFSSSIVRHILTYFVLLAELALKLHHQPSGQNGNHIILIADNNLNLKANLQIFEVFQVFKGTSRDPSDVIIVKEAVG